MAEMKWLMSKGRVRLPVLKAFTFNTPVHIKGNGMQQILPDERRFVAGEHLLDPADPADAAVLAHPFICRDLADGYIEHPQVTSARLEQETRAAEERQRQREALLIEARASLDRATVTGESAHLAGEDIQDELDTPLNQPRRRRGSTGPAADPARLQQELNTPLNQLGKAN